MNLRSHRLNMFRLVSFSIPFVIAPANEPRLKAVLLLQNLETGHWSIWQKERASQKIFSLTGVKDGEYRLAVRSVYEDKLGDVESIAMPAEPELVVVVDSRPPVLVLSLVQTGWSEPQIECLISEHSPDPDSLRVFSVPSAPGKKPQQLAIKITSMKAEGRHWLYRFQCPLLSGVSLIRVELRDQAGNVGSEELDVAEHQLPVPMIRTAAFKTSTSTPDVTEPKGDTARGNKKVGDSSLKNDGQVKSSEKSILFTKSEISGIGWQNAEGQQKLQRTPPVIRLISGNQSEDGELDEFVNPQFAFPPFEDTATQQPSPGEQQGGEQTDPAVDLADELPLPNSRESSPPLVPAIPEVRLGDSLVGTPQSSGSNGNSDSVTDYDILLRAARNSVSLNKYEEALSRFRDCIELDPSRLDARREYASACLSRAIRCNSSVRVGTEQ